MKCRLDLDEMKFIAEEVGISSIRTAMLKLIEEVEKLRKKIRKKELKEKADPFKGKKRERFEEFWLGYPEKKGKEKAWLKFEIQVQTLKDFEDIIIACVNYKAEVKRCRENGQDYLQWLHGSTFCNHNWKDYVNYKPPDDPTADPWEKVKRER